MSHNYMIGCELTGVPYASQAKNITKLTVRWSYEVDGDVALGPAHAAGLARRDVVEAFHWFLLHSRQARVHWSLQVVDFLRLPPGGPPLPTALLGGSG